MNRATLLSGLAMAALIAGAQGALATDPSPTYRAPVQATTTDQTVSNSGDVTNAKGGPQGPDGTPVDIGGGISGNGAGASVSTTGAVASFGLTGINDNFIIPSNGIGYITQDVSNSGAIRTENGSITIRDGGITGDGASASVSAKGSVAGTSITGIGGQAYSPVSGATEIGQTSTNGGWVYNNGNFAVRGDLSGNGGSLSISAAGAGAAAGATFIGTSTSDTAIGRDGISQEVTNYSDPEKGTTARVDNTGTNAVLQGSISGAGASAFVSATGAVASVSIVGIDAGVTDATVGGSITQGSENNAVVNNTATQGLDVSGSISGNGASASISATGAAASVSVRVIDGTGFTTETGNVGAKVLTSQTVINDGAVRNTNSGRLAVGSSGQEGAGDISGHGAGASVGATGAAASVAVTSINNQYYAGSGTFGSVRQIVTNKEPARVTNEGGTLSVANISGNRASASIGAAGAAASVSITTINGNGAITAQTGDYNSQTVANSAAVTNTGSVLVSGSVSGAGASASISAVGASASVSHTTIGK